MELSSDLSGAKEFTIVKRGYDPDEVNAFLDQIATGVGELKRKLAAAESEARQAQASPAPEAGTEADEIHRALILAQRAADEEVRSARARAEEILTDAEQRAGEVTREADERAATVTREADERARTLTRDAEREALQAREKGRADLLADIRGLEEAKAALGHDLDALEQHVEEQREVVQAAIGELQSLIDHPEAFRVAPAPTPTAPEVVVEPLPVPTPDVDLTDQSPAEPPTVSSPPVDDRDDTAPTPVPPPPPGPEPGAVRPGAEPLFDADAADVEDVAEEPDVEPTPPVIDAAPPSAAPPVAPTPAVDQPRVDDDDDNFLAELRKAMLDDEPLGPRDDEPAFPADDDLTPGRRSRFGRRR